MTDNAHAYKPRIKADLVYLQALGQALYNFTYLEWVVIWTIVKLSHDGFGSVPTGKTAREIARALTNAIQNRSPSLSKTVRRKLVEFANAYRDAFAARNKRLHAHPYTAPTGAQQLRGGGHEWPLEHVHAAAKLFEDAAIFGNGIFHGELAQSPP